MEPGCNAGARDITGGNRMPQRKNHLAARTRPERPDGAAPFVARETQAPILISAQSQIAFPNGLICLDSLRFPKLKPSTRARRSFVRWRASFAKPAHAMTAPLFISAALACATTGAAWLWGFLVAAGMTEVPEAGSPDRHDIRTW